MKNIIFLVLVLFMTELSANKTTKTTLYSAQSTLNYLYEGIVPMNRSKGPYGLKSNKSLVRLHLYCYNYPDSKFQDKYDRLLKKSVKPLVTVGLIEIYDNKKGKGTPEQKFFTAISYESSNAFQLDYMDKIATIVDGKIKLSRSRLSKFNVPKKLSQQELEIKIGNLNSGKFKRVKKYQSVPSIFFPYFETVLNGSSKYNGGNLSFGKSANGKSNLYAPEYSFEAETIEAYLLQRGSNKFGLDNPSMSWLNEIEGNLKNLLSDKFSGAHLTLKYLPKANRIKVHISNSANHQNYSGGKNHFFNVKVKKAINGISYEIERTLLAKNYEQKALLADGKRRELAQKKREYEKLKKEKKKATELAQAKKREALMKNSGFETKSISFWNQFPRHSKMLKGIYEGDLSFIKDKFIFNHLFLGYIGRMSDNCTDLLPANRKEIIYEYTTSEKKYQSTSYNGGFDMGSFTDNYSTETTNHTGKLYIDPRFEQKYNEIDEEKNKQYLKMVFNKSVDPFETIKDMKELASFFEIVGCDKNTMYYLGENMLRYLNGDKSLQGEKGIVFE